MREFHLRQSVISKPELITSFGEYQYIVWYDVCYKVENYEVTHLSSMSVDDI